MRKALLNLTNSFLLARSNTHRLDFFFVCGYNNKAAKFAARRNSMLREKILKNAEMKVNTRDMEVLKEFFPSCFDKNGKFDINAFKERIFTENVEIKKENYSLNFLGKSYGRYLASLDSEAVLQPCEEQDENSENVYIAGDNLEALRYLKYSYCQKIKCIYIDPPYNTGADGFIYNDKFDFTAEELAEKIDIDEEEAERILNLRGRNTHSAWLTFMEPRLELARELLTLDGVIFISIDENEYANLKILCDGIFGEANYVSTFVWEKTQHFGRQKLNYYSNSDYIVCYAREKSAAKLKELLVESVTDELEDAPLYNASNNVNELAFPAGTVRFKIADGVYTETGSPDYELTNAVTVEGGVNKNEFSLKFRSRWSNATVREEIAQGTTFLVKTENFAVRAIYGAGRSATVAPKQILFTNQSNPRCTKSRTGERIDTSENATKALCELMGAEVFSYPKPVSLIKYLLTLLYDEKSGTHLKDYTVLDFFSGSGTTAHAVMELNAQDGGKRKFIAVQIPESLDDSLASAENLAERALLQNAIKLCDATGRERNLAEVGRERIARAANKIREENPLSCKGADLGCKTYYLRTPSKQTLDKLRDFEPDALFDVADVKSEFGAGTILASWKVLDGYGFAAATKPLDLCGYTAYTVSDSNIGTAVYLLDDMPQDAVKELVRKLEAFELNADRIVTYGYALSFTSDLALKENLSMLKNRPPIKRQIRY